MLLVGALALTGAVAGPAAVEPAAAVPPAALNPFGMNGGFTVYAREDLRLDNDETEGSLAAGDMVTRVGGGQYAIAHIIAGTGDYVLPTVDGDPTRLLMGRFDPTSEGIIGVTSAGTTEPALLGDMKVVERSGPFTPFARGNFLRYGTDPTNPDREPLIEATHQQFPQDAAFPAGAAGNGSIYTVDTSAQAVASYVERNRQATYTDAASCLAGVADPTLGVGNRVTVAQDAGDRVVLSPLSGSQPNVIDYAAVSKASLIQFSPGQTPGVLNPLVIRVPAGTTTVSAARVDPVGARSHSRYILWDLSAVTGSVTVKAAQSRIDGSIYAPEANVTVDASPLDGQVIGRNVTLQGGEVHSYLFASTIACDTNAGDFRVRKALIGITPGDLPNGTSFTVNYTATVPGGQEAKGSVVIPANGDWVTPEARFPAGTVVTFDEVPPAVNPGWTWMPPVISPPSVTIAAGSTADVVVTNEATRTLGTFTVSKRIIDDAGASPPRTGSVPVTWRATTAAGTQIGTGKLTVGFDGLAVGPVELFPSGTEIALSEDLTGIAPPPGYTWGSASWNPGSSFTILGTTPVAVELTNLVHSVTAQRTVTVVKSAPGSAADPRFGYEISYNDGPDTRGTRQLTVGTPAPLSDLETGAAVLRLAERVPTLDGEPVNPADWELPVFSVSVDGGTPQTFTPANFEGAGDLETAIVDIPLPSSGNVVIEIGNRLRSGSFQVSKALSGLSASDLPADTSFSVDWTATGPGLTAVHGTVNLPADGSAVAPGDAAGVPFAFPYGTVITLIENTPPAIPGIAWGAPTYNPTRLTIGAGGLGIVSSVVTNTGTVQRGTFEVVKRLEGIEPAALADVAFTVDYEALLPNGTTTRGSVQVPADGTPSRPTDAVGARLTFPLGTTIELRERTPDPLVLPQGYSWGGATWSRSSLTIIEPDGTVRAEVTNSVQQLARFSVTKTVTGSAADLVPSGTQFGAEWWLDGEPQPSLVFAPGATATSPYFPVGSIVEVAEATLPSIPGVTWLPAQWGLQGAGLNVEGDGRTVVPTQGVEPGTTLGLTLTNTANASDTAAFSVTKIVTGPSAGLVDANTSFTVEYTVDGVPQTPLTIHSGATVSVPDLPDGAVVRLREETPPDLDGVVWGTPAWELDGTTLPPDDGWVTATVAAGDVLAFSLENLAQPESIAVTGGGGLSPLVPIGALAFILVGVALVASRRRSA